MLLFLINLSPVGLVVDLFLGVAGHLAGKIFRHRVEHKRD